MGRGPAQELQSTHVSHVLNRTSNPFNQGWDTVHWEDRMGACDMQEDFKRKALQISSNLWFRSSFGAFKGKVGPGEGMLSMEKGLRPPCGTTMLKIESSPVSNASGCISSHA